MSARTKAKRLASRRRFAASFDWRAGIRHLRFLCRECDGPIGHCADPCPCAPLRDDEQHLLDDFLRAIQGEP